MATVASDTTQTSNHSIFITFPAVLDFPKQSLQRCAFLFQYMQDYQPWHIAPGLIAVPSKSVSHQNSSHKRFRVVCHLHNTFVPYVKDSNGHVQNSPHLRTFSLSSSKIQTFQAIRPQIYLLHWWRGGHQHCFPQSIGCGNLNVFPKNGSLMSRLIGVVLEYCIGLVCRVGVQYRNK